jgi:ubiquinone/menaquinone biosynthesis C-methylase UbiE
MCPNVDRYTHGHDGSVLASHRSRTAADSAAYLVPRLRAGMRLLDVGCGPGTISVDLASLVAPGEAIALDREESVLAEVERLAQARNLASLSTAVGDVYALPWADGAFDVVHAHQLLQHLTDPVAALREMRRVSRPGGLVAVRDADFGAMTWFPAEPRLDDWRRI